MLFLGPDRNGKIDASAGFTAGLFWVATLMGITYLFERKSMKLFFINAGYHVVTFTLMGFILGHGDRRGARSHSDDTQSSNGSLTLLSKRVRLFSVYENLRIGRRLKNIYKKVEV
ncbi:MAG: DUF1761 domain-containing protein [Bacillota bacterium]